MARGYDAGLLGAGVDCEEEVVGPDFKRRGRARKLSVGRPRFSAVSRIVVSITLAVCVSASASACGGGSSSGTTGGAVNPDLRVAIGFLPSAADASYIFQFADWGSIEQAFGYSAGRLASAHAGNRFVTKLYRLSSGGPGGNGAFDLALPGTGNVWSIADVLWDAEEFPIHGGAPLAITAFRNGSVISRVEKHLTKCGFRSHDVGGLSLYSGARSVALNCLSPVGTGIPFPFVVYAFDSTDRLVLQSASPTAVTAAIANRQHHTSNRVLNAVLGSLGNVPQVAVALGPEFCSELSSPPFLAGRNPTPSTVIHAEHVFPDATPYLGFGFGYRYPAGGVSARLAFVYSSAAVARSDVNRREKMLRNGLAFTIDEPYSTLFRVRSGQAQGRAAVYQIGQAGTSPLRLGTVFDQNDIGFARC
jgi:hypothetical protein